MFEDDLSVVAILPGLISSSFLSFQRNFSGVTLNPFFFLVSGIPAHCRAYCFHLFPRFYESLS